MTPRTRSRHQVGLALALALAAAPAWSASVHGTLRTDPDVPLGADPAGRLRLYAPDPVDPGSSISHWDLPATPDLLMEPFIGPGAEIGELDLTVEQLEDIGWSSGSARIVVHYRDAPGTGFLTPGTLGDQRRAAIELVASIWSGLLRSSVVIHIDASFQDLHCADGSATLAQAGPAFIFESFSGAEILRAWYPGALAEALSGQNLSLEDDVDPDAGDIDAMFNTGIDNGCLGGGASFDYSLSGRARPGKFSFVNVAMHEIGHGLGFLTLVDETTGANPMGIPDIYSFFTRDTSSGLLWHQMTDAERVVSARNTGRLVWDGPNVNAIAPSILGPGPVLQIDSPSNLQGTYEVAVAQFGPSLTQAGVSAAMIPVDDGSGSPREGCQPLRNDATLRGQIALMMRGTCGFEVKVKNAQDAGAAAVVVVNNMDGPPMVPGLSDSSITIPAAMIRKEDGERLFDAIGGQPTPTPTPPAPPPGNPGPPPPPPPPTPQPPSSGPSATLDPVVRFEQPSTCVPNGSTLCLEHGRFRVRARWTTRQGAVGDGHAVSLTGDSGHFWFFDAANVEIVLKVKNACGAPFNHYWFFAAGLTDVDTVIEVADTRTGRVLTYHNPQARPFPAVQDTDAFPTCP